jgi:serine/threonine protein kinase/Flp pilus assembly protein TadD
MSERDVFIAALQKGDPAQRRAYLDEACAGRPDLRRQVEQLLRLHEGAGSFLEKPATESPAASPEGPGAAIGPYKLLEAIGEGGMGTVWMAQQTEPVRRLVAVKLIKAGMDSAQVIARFEAERQALALMDHPHIARVLEAGTTGSGRPYFVMELVKGVPITRYCDEHRLTPRQRLELFVPVCQAVQHAHQKGIIHRDLKPSNVLVAPYDGKPVPKVIDFGVAKAAGQSLTDRTLVTGFGVVVGTLEYMSPEQAEINQLDIDTRSDIYSLGVLLYELLAGSPPFSRKGLEMGGMLEMLQMIREQEPTKPSAKLSTAEALPTLAANRGTEPAKLARLVRGELDWIVMKALEKDRNRRYETADSFAMDVQRYLADEPVLACPPSAGYRLRKFARRNRSGLAVAGLVLFFLVLLGSVAGWAWRDRAARAAERANQLERAVERAELLQREGKRREALEALEAAQLLGRQAQPAPPLAGRIDSLQQRLDAEGRDEAFVARIEAIRSEVQTEVDVEKNKFGRIHSYFPLREALEQYGVAVGVTPPAAAAAGIQKRPAAVQAVVVSALNECLRYLPAEEAAARGWLFDVLEKADGDPWRNGVRHAWGQPRKLEALVKDIDVGRQPPMFLLLVARALPAQSPGRLDLARRVQLAYPGDFWANHELGLDLHHAGKNGEAIRYYTAALALRPDNPGVLLNRAIAQMGAGELKEAAADFQRAIALAPQYAHAHYGLGNALFRQKHLDEAVAAYRKAIALDPQLVAAYVNLGAALAKQNKLDDAITTFRKAIDLNPKFGLAHSQLGETYARFGRWDEAAAAYARALELDEEVKQAHAQNPNPGQWAFWAPRLLLAGDADGYRRLCARVIEKLGDTNDPETAYLVARIGTLAPDAVPDPTRLVRIAERAVRADPLPHHLHTLGLAHYRAGRFDEAIRQLNKSVEGNWNANAANWLVLAMAHQRLGQSDEARKWFDRAVRWMEDNGVGGAVVASRA